MLPKPIHDAAAAFDSLPGIGPRAALRYAYWLAAQSKDLIRSLAQAIEALSESMQRCQLCGMWTDAVLCAICADLRREQNSLCIVATSQNVLVIEESGAFKGRYHVLGGLLDPIEGKTPETLNLASLVRRLSAPSNTISEIILALDPNVAGDTTALYITKKLSTFPVNVTRLARGLQHGAQIEYADGATIVDALQNRRVLKNGG